MPSIPQFQMFVDLDNDAFENRPASELARILRHVAALVEEGDMCLGSLLDVNGNTVGDARITCKDALRARF